MVVDNDKYLYKVRNNIERKSLNIIAYDINSEEFIIKNLLLFTKNFIIITSLEENIIMKNNVNNFCYCNYENCLTKLKKIFEYNKNIIDVYNSNDLFHYIVFIKEVKKNDEYFDYFMRCFDFSTIVNLVKNYKYFKLCFLDNNAIMFFSKKKEQINLDVIDNNDFICLCPFLGIGDYFLFYSIIVEYCKLQKKDIYFPIVDNVSIMKSKIYFSNYKKLYFDNESMFRFACSMETQNIFDIHKNFMINHLIKQNSYNDLHITEIIKKQLKIETNFDVYKYNDELNSAIINNISKHEKIYIDKKIHKGVVGVQFFTGIYDSKNDIWKTDISRIWDEQNIYCFYKLCLKRNIEVINITQSPVSIIPTLKKLSLEGYVYAISKLSLLVGIDSSAGHVASFYNIPSITIFNSNPFYSKDIKSNYRPLRNNISLYTKNEEKVSFKDVFKLVESCAKNDFNFKNHMIDSKNKYNCIVKDNFWSN